MVDAYNDWRDERPDDRSERRGVRRGEFRNEPRLEQRLDQWVSAGRQLVDGVSGARPGSRPGGRASGLKLDHLGRWVEDKLDWLLEDEEGWRESWEQPQPRQQPTPQPRPSRREPLQAISRRQPARSVALPDRPSSAADAEGWPDDDSFSVSRWQRRDGGVQAPSEESMEPAPRIQRGRTVPRSSRRRSD
jgi:hypothetical protein